jgi:hypothetical protein
LAFAAGELVGEVPGAAGEADPGECLAGQRLALPARNSRVEQARCDVLGGGESVGEVELLEDEA